MAGRNTKQKIKGHASDEATLKYHIEKTVCDCIKRTPTEELKCPNCGIDISENDLKYLGRCLDCFMRVAPKWIRESVEPVTDGNKKTKAKRKCKQNDTQKK